MSCHKSMDGYESDSMMMRDRIYLLILDYKYNNKNMISSLISKGWWTLSLISYQIIYLDISVHQINPNPWLFFIMKSMFFSSFYLDSYSGSKNTLKQVWAVGKLSWFACLWIKKFIDLKPSKGTRSLPVQKNKKAFLSSKLKFFRISHKFLRKK